MAQKFIIKPFPKNPYYVKVVLFKNLKERDMLYPDESKYAGSEQEGNPKTLKVAEIHLYAPFYLDLISHECLHATIDWLRRFKLKYDFTKSYCTNKEEKICYIQQILMSRIMTKIENEIVSKQPYLIRRIDTEYREVEEFYGWPK